MTLTANGRATGHNDEASTSTLSLAKASSSLPISKSLLDPRTAVATLLGPKSTVGSLLGVALDSAEWVLNVLSKDGAENMFLSGNFAPVPEVPGLQTGLRITGTVPEYVNGEFVRVGPNPKYKPSANYHWFDGDGMLHGVRIANGTATYFNRFVGTSRLKQEDDHRRPMFIKIGDMKGMLGLVRMLLGQARTALGIIDDSQGAGTANTALVYHGGALLALNEGDKPYAVRVLEDGHLETLGRLDYGGQLDHNFTAHPKVDPVTGELFTFCYNLQSLPHLIYRVVSAAGYMGPKVPITIPDPIMMHDFAITERYSIFMDLPLVFDPKTMVKNSTLPFVYKDDRPSRFGILPRYDTTEANIKWFIRPPCVIFHIANAWEEGDEVVLIACRFESFTLGLENPNQGPQLLTEFRFNMKTGSSSETTLADIRCDFPRVNEQFTGRKQRFVYASVFDNVVDVVGVAKFDLSRKPVLLEERPKSAVGTAKASIQTGGTVVGFFEFGPGRMGSEPVFVPRGGDEDGGCLLNMVFDSNTNLSEVVIIDAKTMSVAPLATIDIGCRVPYGFHGTFVSEEEIKKQRPLKAV